MGKAALEGQHGVESVSKGWKNGKEINTVLFDERKISKEKLEKVLKQSGTYRQTLSHESVPEP